MASSIINPHSNHIIYNHQQRNHNNNMTHQKGKSVTNGKSTTSSGNDYYNKYGISSSVSMTKIVDNSSSKRNHQQNQGNSTSYYNLQEDYLEPKSQQNVGESRREQRERRERDYVPAFLLMDACKSNNERKVREICRKLYTLSEDDVQPVINFQDQTGRTPLSVACTGGSIALIDELSRVRFIDPNLGDNDSNTPLHFASQAGHSEAVDLMIARFGDTLDINCRNSGGLTPLMKAALQGRTRCAKSLLSAGAASNLRDYSRGLTAAEWARLCGRHICSEVIIRSAKDNYHRHSSSSAMTNFPPKPLPGSKSNMEFKRMSSDESPYYHLYARSTVNGATWLKNKIKKALGGSGASTNSSVRSLADKRPTVSDGSCALMGGATICASSLVLPSITPLIQKQRSKHAAASTAMNKKFTIPTVQVTPVKR